MDQVITPGLEHLYRSLTPEQVARYKKFGEYMYSNFDGSVIDMAQKENEKNYVANLLAYLRSGLKWTQLNSGEIAMIKNNCHESHYEEFEKAANLNENGELENKKTINDN